MQYKTIYFGDNEKAALDFINDNWDRIVSARFISGQELSDGWVIAYSKEAVTPTEVKFVPEKTTAKKR